ncbi:MAG: DUF2958 domain-containing protein [Gammaproteobacteria bacterium]|nr:DUF2958 domain-containing protein [Gammaproteobacteria bacterium]
MKLLTNKIIAALPEFYSTEEIPLAEKLVICKFFTPDNDWTWFVFEGELIEQANTRQKDYRFFGMVHGYEQELGYFMLSELEAARGSLGMEIERDPSIFKVPYQQCIEEDESSWTEI